MTKTKYRIIFGFISSILILLLILAEIFWKEENWIIDAISLLCGIASLAGVALALIQIQKTDDQIKAISETTEKINKAVDDNREELRDFLSFAELRHLVGLIQTTQTFLRNNDFSSAVFLMQEIKDQMIRAGDQFEELRKKDKIPIPKAIKNLTIDIESLSNHMMKLQRKESSTIILEGIHANLEISRGIIIKIENKLKQKKL